MMKSGYLLAMLCLCPLLAQAEIYKAVDAEGHVTYSSSPMKGAKKIILEPLPTLPPTPRARSSATPEDFPKVDGATQRSRDDTRRTILQDELNTEAKLFDESSKNLKAAEAARDKEKLKSLADQVELHQKNIDALKTELSKLK